MSQEYCHVHEGEDATNGCRLCICEKCGRPEYCHSLDACWGIQVEKLTAELAATVELKGIVGASERVLLREKAELTTELERERQQAEHMAGRVLCFNCGKPREWGKGGTFTNMVKYPQWVDLCAACIDVAKPGGPRIGSIVRTEALKKEGELERLCATTAELRPIIERMQKKLDSIHAEMGRRAELRGPTCCECGKPLGVPKGIAAIATPLYCDACAEVIEPVEFRPIPEGGFAERPSGSPWARCKHCGAEVTARYFVGELCGFCAARLERPSESAPKEFRGNSVEGPERHPSAAPDRPCPVCASFSWAFDARAMLPWCCRGCDYRPGENVGEARRARGIAERPSLPPRRSDETFSEWALRAGLPVATCPECGKPLRTALGGAVFAGNREVRSGERFCPSCGWCPRGGARPKPAQPSSNVSRLPQGLPLGAMRGEKAMKTTSLGKGESSVLRRGLKAPASDQSQVDAGSRELTDLAVQKVCSAAIATPDGSAHQPSSENGTGVQGSGDAGPDSRYLCQATCPHCGGDHVEVVANADELPEQVHCRCGNAYFPNALNGGCWAIERIDAAEVRSAEARAAKKAEGDEGAPRAQTPGGDAFKPHDRVWFISQKGPFMAKGTIAPFDRKQPDLLRVRPDDGGPWVVVTPEGLERIEDETKPWGAASRKGLRQRTGDEGAPRSQTPGVDVSGVAPRNVRITPAELKKQGEVYRAICPKCESIITREGYAPDSAFYKPDSATTCDHCGESIENPGWVLWGKGVAAELREKFEREALETRRVGARSAFFARFAPEQVSPDRMAERVKEELENARSHVAEAMYALGRAASIVDRLDDAALGRWLRQASETLHEGRERADRVTVVLGLPNDASEAGILEWWVTPGWAGRTERLPAKLLRRHGPLVLLEVERTAAASWWSLETWEPLEDHETGPRRGWTLECKGGVR